MSFNLKQFEKETGISAEKMTETKMAEILGNEKYIHFFEDPHQAVDLIGEIIDYMPEGQDKKEIQTVLIGFVFLEDEKLMVELFKKERNEIEEKIQEYFHSDDPILVLTSIMCSMISLQNISLSDEKENIETAIGKIKDIFGFIGKVENSFMIRNDLIDLVNNVCSEYFKQYEADLLPDWLEGEEEKVNAFEMEQHKDLNEKNLLDIQPEDIGFIDITKMDENQ